MAVERQGLIQDDLIRLAHEIDPDAQTSILSSAQSITQEMGSERGSTENEQYVREALEALEDLIDH